MVRFKMVAAAAASVGLVAIAAPTGGAQDPAPAQAEPAPTTALAAPQPMVEPPQPSCAKLKQHRRAIRQALRYSHRGGDFRARLNQRALERAGDMRSCAKRHYRERYKKMRKRWESRKAVFDEHRRIDRLTIYGAWAKPLAVINCEGGVNGWDVSNYEGSGAHGPYQLLNKGEPWPVTTWRHMARHHEIAAGLGISHWEASAHCWRH